MPPAWRVGLAQRIAAGSFLAIPLNRLIDITILDWHARCNKWFTDG